MSYLRNTSITVHFVLIDAADGSAVTSGTPTPFVTKDGGTQAAATNAAVHEGNGQWSLALTASEMDATSVGVLITETGSVPVHYQLSTVPANTNTQIALIEAMRGTDNALLAASYTAPDNASITAILADTNELQTDDVPGLIAALNDPTAAAIADAVWDETQAAHVTAGTFGEIATETANILADTNELQTDDVPGLIAALNNLSAAQVNTEVDNAIETYHLDHLFAADYDPASKPGAATALLNELVESDAGVSRFTANALEQAPSGTGASAATIADAVWDELQADHTAAGSFGETATEIASVLADTNELQTDDVPGLIAALNNLSAAQVRTELSTELGRIDVAISTRNATAPDNATISTINGKLPANTATQIGLIETMRGTDSALLASSYVAPDNASISSILGDTAPLGNMIVADVWSAASMANSPISDATLALQNTIVTHLTDIKGATFDGATDSNEAIRNRGDAAWVTGSGGGGTSVTDADVDKIAAAVLAGDKFVPNKTHVWQLKRDATSAVVVVDGYVIPKLSGEELVGYADFGFLLGKGEAVSEILSSAIVGGTIALTASSEGITGRYVHAEFTGGASLDVATWTVKVRTTEGQEFEASVQIKVP